jgi:transposase-like protein
VASKVNVSNESLHKWVRQAEVDAGIAAGHAERGRRITWNST